MPEIIGFNSEVETNDIYFYAELAMEEIANQPGFDADYFRNGSEALFQTAVVTQCLMANKGRMPIDAKGKSLHATHEMNNLIFVNAIAHAPGLKLPENWPYSKEEMIADFYEQYGDLYQVNIYEFPWVTRLVSGPSDFLKN